MVVQMSITWDFLPVFIQLITQLKCSARQFLLCYYDMIRKGRIMHLFSTFKNQPYVKQCLVEKYNLVEKMYPVRFLKTFNHFKQKYKPICLIKERSFCMYLKNLPELFVFLLVFRIFEIVKLSLCSTVFIFSFLKVEMKIAFSMSTFISLAEQKEMQNLLHSMS